MPTTKLPTAGIQFASLSTRFTLAGIAASAALMALPGAAQAGGYTPPASLNPGDHYRLVFVTSTAIDATSNNIATYNSFVSTAAALNPALPTTTWMAIASTASVNAIDNIACTPSCASDPIFLVDNTEVAASTADLFSGTLLHAINLTESGSTTVPKLNGSSYAWTGSMTNGSTFTNAGLGASGNYVVVGNYTLSADYYIIASNALSTYTAPMYAISAELTVPSVPEPAALSLLASGGLLTFLAGRLRRQRRASV